MMRVVSVSAATIAMTAVAMAQVPFNTDDCPEQEGYQWCASRASAQGWQLKYESTNPPGMMDAEWHVQVWVRDHVAMLCEYRSGRGGIRANFCEALKEAAQ